MELESRSSTDLIGTALSGACLVHCVTMPGLLAAAPAAASVFGGFHPVLLGLVIVVALAAFAPGWKTHRSLAVVALASVGVALLGGALLFDEGVLETVMSVAGALAMMGAHLRNRQLVRG
jgi:hypothetical protein